MGYAAEGKVVCGVEESCAGMGCSYRNHYQWMGEECQDGDAGLPLDCTPTPVPTPMPTPQPMRTSRKRARDAAAAPRRRVAVRRDAAAVVEPPATRYPWKRTRRPA